MFIKFFYFLGKERVIQTVRRKRIVNESSNNSNQNTSNLTKNIDKESNDLNNYKGDHSKNSNYSNQCNSNLKRKIEEVSNDLNNDKGDNSRPDFNKNKTQQSFKNDIKLNDKKTSKVSDKQKNTISLSKNCNSIKPKRNDTSTANKRIRNENFGLLSLPSNYTGQNSMYQNRNCYEPSNRNFYMNKNEFHSIMNNNDYSNCLQHRNYVSNFNFNNNYNNNYSIYYDRLNDRINPYWKNDFQHMSSNDFFLPNETISKNRSRNNYY